MSEKERMTFGRNSFIQKIGKRCINIFVGEFSFLRRRSSRIKGQRCKIECLFKELRIFGVGRRVSEEIAAKL